MPTLADGHDSRLEHVWKRFRADRAAAAVHDQLCVCAPDGSAGHGATYRWVLKDVNLACRAGPGAMASSASTGRASRRFSRSSARSRSIRPGTCDLGGRIGALLEVRCGIHPLLTGPGEHLHVRHHPGPVAASRSRQRFDAIVDFAEVGDAIDRQVKFYLDRHAVRLGFSIAAFFEPTSCSSTRSSPSVTPTSSRSAWSASARSLPTAPRCSSSPTTLRPSKPRATGRLWLADAVVRAAASHQRRSAQLYRASVGEAAVDYRAGQRRNVAQDRDHRGRRQPDPLGRRPQRSDRAESEEAMFGVFHIGISQGTAMPVFVISLRQLLPRGPIRAALPTPQPAVAQRSLLRCGGPCGPAWHRAHGIAALEPLASFEAFGPDLIRAPWGS